LTRFQGDGAGEVVTYASKEHGVPVNHDAGDGASEQTATDLSVTPQIVDGESRKQMTDPTNPGLDGLHWLMPRATATREMDKDGGTLVRWCS
jgi:hypothetical protein